jgi:dihydrofolate reductase/diadenosine tetraphosphate (Ap4A) HIT family hydrolase
LITIIAACSNNWVIGRDGALPWRLPSDLRRFRELTLGHAVVMGRKTFESLPPAQRPLPGRRNLVVTSDPMQIGDGVEAFSSLDAALDATGHDCFVIGGERLFREALPLAGRLELTHVDVACAGDAFFPALTDDEWRCIDERAPLVENDHTFVFRTYERVTTPLYDLDAARSAEQRDQMASLEAAGICIFCPENTETYKRHPIEAMGDHWFVVKNDYPYTGTSAHYLIVAKRHVRSFDELPDEAGAELWAFKRKLRAELDPLAVATVERSGDMRYNGGSVAHLHVHFVALDTIPDTPVRFRVSGRLESPDNGSGA